jgi:hypothetical protein
MEDDNEKGQVRMHADERIVSVLAVRDITKKPQY